GSLRVDAVGVVFLVRSIGTPRCPRKKRMLGSIFLIARPPLLAVRRGGEYAKNAYPWLISLHRFAVHYSLLRMIAEDPISAIERLPHWAMTRLNSRRRIDRTLSTPAWPKDATPHMYGRPMHIARAPRARALKTSVPRRNPPSTKTGTRLRTT